MVPIKPAGAGFADVANGMNRAGGNENFFTDFRLKGAACNFKFHLSLKHHEKLVGFVAIIFPDLTGRVYPKVA